MWGTSERKMVGNRQILRGNVTAHQRPLHRDLRAHSLLLHLPALLPLLCSCPPLVPKALVPSACPRAVLGSWLVQGKTINRMSVGKMDK